MFEASKYLQTDNQIVQTVAMTGQMASQLPAKSSVEDVQRIWGAAPLIAPEAAAIARKKGSAAWSSVLALTITSVAFTKTVASCTASCDYEAKVAWSVGASPAACGKLQKAANDAAPSRTAVPAQLYGEGSAISVFASLSYEPRLSSVAAFLPGMGTAFTTGMTEAGWFQPRNTAQIVLSASGSGSPPFTLCSEVNK